MSQITQTLALAEAHLTATLGAAISWASVPAIVFEPTGSIVTTYSPDSDGAFEYPAERDYQIELFVEQFFVNRFSSLLRAADVLASPGDVIAYISAGETVPVANSLIFLMLERAVGLGSFGVLGDPLYIGVDVFPYRLRDAPEGITRHSGSSVFYRLSLMPYHGGATIAA